MPIINGVYVNDSLPDAKSAQKQVFGEYSSRDMSDYSTYALNYLAKQQEQAYNLQLWNLTNEYNSPAAQMKRYQDAGLNPNLIYGQQNVAQSPAAASAFQGRSAGTASKATQNAISWINQLQGIVKSARDTYDYVKYGRSKSFADLTNAQLQGNALSLRNAWEGYLIGEPTYTDIEHSPRGRMYQAQTQTSEQRYRQLVLLCNMIPDQQARVKALTALDEYRQEIMKGQNDAVLNIHTGNETADSWIKALLYLGMNAI